MNKLGYILLLLPLTLMAECPKSVLSAIDNYPSNLAAIHEDMKRLREVRNTISITILKNPSLIEIQETTIYAMEIVKGSFKLSNAHNEIATLAAEDYTSDSCGKYEDTFYSILDWNYRYIVEVQYTNALLGRLIIAENRRKDGN